MKQIARILIVVLTGSLFGSGAHAASSDIRLEKAEIRLLDGGPISGGQRVAGFDIRLQAGVKTYWRMPGDSGLPPVFDFSASQNIASVEIKWPQPDRFTEADGTILGFKERVIFPFIITPKNPAEPVTLAVNADFGLCDTLCLPAKADLVMMLSRDGKADHKADIASFLARVPQPASVKGAVQPSIMAIEPEGKMLALTVASDTPLKDVILEAQGSWFFGMALITQDGAGRYRVRVPIEQKPSSATLSGLAVTLTAIAEGAATETSVSLDATGSIR